MAHAAENLRYETIDDAAYDSLDKRGTQEPVPADLHLYLNERQLKTLATLKAFGWILAFVRRPLFERPVVVVSSPGAQQYATIEEDGALNLEPNIFIRD